MENQIHKDICNERFFSSFFKKHVKRVNSFLYFKYGERFNPDDKVQEAFMKVWQNCHKISPDKAKSYLYTTANNLMLNEVSHQKVKIKYRESKTNEINNESPEFILEEKEYLKKIETAIANLTEPQRVAFLLNRIEGEKFKEIAEILDISVKAVEKRIYGALKKLRRDIENL